MITLIKRTCLWAALFAFIGGMSSCNKHVAQSGANKTVIVYPKPPEPARFQFLTKITTSRDLGGRQSTFSKLILGEEKAKGMVKPYGIAIHKGKMYVCDNYGGGMEIIDLDKKKLDFFIPRGRGQLRTPINCFVDEKGYLYIADVGRYEIVVFDDKGNYVKSFGEKEKFKPSDVAVSGNKIYVGNIADHNVNVYSNDSLNQLLYSIPNEKSAEAYPLGFPVNIAVGGDKLYAADFGHSRIQIYTTSGEFIDTIGTMGDRPGQFSKLKGIALDKDENIFAVDAAFENLQIFNKEGKLLLVIGGHYEGPGDLMLPAKVIVDYDNISYFQKYVDAAYDLKYLVIVTNQYGPDLINIYGRVEPKAKSGK